MFSSRTFQSANRTHWDFATMYARIRNRSVRVRFQPKSLNTQAKVFRVLSTEQGQALRVPEKTILGPRACGLFSEKLVRPEHDLCCPCVKGLRPQGRNIEFIKLKLLWKTHTPSRPCCYAMQRTTTDTDLHCTPRIRNRNTKYLFSSDDHPAVAAVLHKH